MISFGNCLSLHYALCWLCTGIFCAAAMSMGHALVRWLVPGDLDLQEELVLEFAAGVLALATLVFFAGVLGMLRAAFFFTLPLSSLLLFGLPAVRDLGPRVRAAISGARRAPRAPLWVTVALCFGALGVALVYLPILSPENISFDARWYHLAIAEHYATAHAIRPFPEGLMAGTYPQLATQIYCWALLSPFGELFDRVELAAHLEFALFVATLAGIPVLVRRLVPNTRVSWSWTALFLFPGIFVYDSELCGGADHVSALFAIPILVALFRAWDELSPRDTALLGLFVSGVLLTKYTAASVALAPILALTLRAFFMSVRARLRGQRWLAPLTGLAAFAATGVIVTSQHWLRNWIFYGDPVYPLLAPLFHPHPWTADSAEWARAFATTQQASYVPGTHVVHGFFDLLYVLATFSVDVHDFLNFHGKVPVFGSLFSVATLALPFLARSPRVWAANSATYGGLVVWALLRPEDRYLQALLPWMVAVTVATGILAWQAGRVLRVAVCVSVGLQLAWGSDLFAIPSHAMTGRAPIRAALDLLGENHLRSDSEWLHPFGIWPKIGAALPRNARPLLHEADVHLGLGAPAVLDTIPFMFGIDYGRQPSARGVDDLLHRMGVTHLVWQPASLAEDSVAGDLAFFSYAVRFTERRIQLEGYLLATLPDSPPPNRPFGPAVVISCGSGAYASGVYAFTDLATREFPKDVPHAHPRPRRSWGELSPALQAQALAGADFVVTETGCALSSDDPARAFLGEAVPPGYLWLARRAPYVLYARALEPHS